MEWGVASSTQLAQVSFGPGGWMNGYGYGRYVRSMVRLWLDMVLDLLKVEGYGHEGSS